MTEPSCLAEPLVDTHCHLDDPTLAERLDELLSRALGVGVGQFVVPGVSPECWPRIAAIADRSDRIFPAYGLHPMHAGEFSPSLLEELKTFSRNAVAIGEIGLDYMLTGVSRAAQAEAFRQQLRFAVKEGLPVLIHCRHAFADLLGILREERITGVGGIMHAFSGSPEIASECVKLGLLISIAGPVTFQNAVRPGRVAAMVPFSRLVLETDAPDLAPEPHRGMPNEPAFLPHIAGKVAAIRGVPYPELCEMTSNNARTLLRMTRNV